MYLVSILVPVYGVEKYIERCARSLFGQTYQNLEYIFVDDCSPDRSIELLENVINDYPHRKIQIRIIRHSMNKGIAAVRNTAVNAANGLFICHVDSDDYLDVDAIRLMVEDQQINQSDIVTVGACRLYKDHIDYMRQSPSNSKEQFLLFVLQPNFDHTIWGRLIRLSLYKDYGIMNKDGFNQGEDWWTTPRLIYYAQSISCIRKVLYYYDCTRDDSMCVMNSHNHSVTTWLKDIVSIESVVGFFADKEDMYRKASLRMAIYCLYMYLCWSAYYGEKKIFERIKNKILRNDTETLSFIGWNRPIKKCLMSNYYICKSYFSFPILRKSYFLIHTLAR